MKQLVTVVARTLSSLGLDQSSGRVRAIPDARTIRYYTTVSLLDRPLEFRGRTAIYGRRHLRQIVAIKRLQAAGRSLGEIQAAVPALSDEALAELAALPEVPPPAVETGSIETVPAETVPAGTVPAEPSGETVALPRQTPFWQAPPAPVAPAPATIPALQLAPGVVLVLPPGAHPTGASLRAIAEAAAPLLRCLATHGLVQETDHEPPAEERRA